MEESFIKPDSQCPKKPRGRKKKQQQAAATDSKTPATSASTSITSKGRPSAAACGFSTEGMTNEDIQKRLEEGKQESQAKPSRKRLRKLMHEDEEVDNKDAEKRMKTEQASEAEVPCKKTKKQKRRSKTEVEQTSNSSTLDVPAPEPEQPKRKRTKRRKTGSKVTKGDAADSIEPAETDTINAADNIEPAEGDTINAADNIEPAEGDNTDEIASDAAEASDQEMTAAEIAKAEAKAKASRKSSAYHKARADAKKRGLTDEAAKKAGKAVTWKKNHNSFAFQKVYVAQDA